MMKGLETGRIQVASRALGVARAAFEDALRYAQERETFGKPIWQHQSIGNYLADMATKLTAARQLTLLRRRALRQRRALRHGGRHGQAVRLRGGDGDRARRGPHPRRLRLLHRVRRRALLPRRPADDRRRGHQRDPAQRDRRAVGGPRRDLAGEDRARVSDSARTSSRRDRRGPLPRRRPAAHRVRTGCPPRAFAPDRATRLSRPCRRGRGVSGAGAGHLCP